MLAETGGIAPSGICIPCPSAETEEGTFQAPRMMEKGQAVGRHAFFFLPSASICQAMEHIPWARHCPKC